METVYRLENTKDGKGPYSDSIGQTCKNPTRIGIQTLLYKRLGTFGHQGNEHPSLYEDGIDWENTQKGNEYPLCAFPNKKGIIEWFTPEEIKYLIKSGYRLRKFKVRTAIIGRSGKQCLFFKSDIIN